MPACRSGAAASTVAVNGATVKHMPRPNSETPGSTSTRYDVSLSTRTASSIAAADESNGPTVIGSRGPIRVASAPIRDDSRSSSTVIGISADPAASGE